MKLPAIQYGAWREVRPRMKKLITRVVRHGASFVDEMTRDGMIDVDDHPEEIDLGRIPHGAAVRFYAHQPLLMLSNGLPWNDLNVERRIFDESLTTTWGVLGLLSQAGKLWVHQLRDRWPALCDAIDRSWSELASVGARYAVTDEMERLWSITGPLQYVLIHSGVPEEVILKRAPLPPGGPIALLRRYRPAA